MPGTLTGGPDNSPARRRELGPARWTTGTFGAVRAERVPVMAGDPGTGDHPRRRT
ncbi:hypothetical protein [Amycolatopsis umgeniensis]|uniref:Uncharacterized protein n=1 Tax=Amycolatopsis umgeniensis TaxID=336628 RepID=A0A841AV59_9PSEU|nr:hypothetical protein [Amycolatopsis umgeniensis]MBB5850867.1 hypothetical protein [Amycolatopsis umgeniensis]